MNRDELSELSDHLKYVGIKAVHLDRYLQRRAWGIYYSIWALSFFLFAFLTYPIELIPQEYLRDVAYIFSYTIIIAVAGYVTGVVFSKAIKLSKFENTIFRKYQANKPKNFSMSYIMLLIIVALVITGTLLLRNFAGLFLITSFLALLDIYIYRMIRKSLGRLPPEAIAAVSVFMLSDLGGALATVILRSAYYFGYFWIPTIIVWFLASVYSIYNASEELTSQDSSQE